MEPRAQLNLEVDPVEQDLNVEQETVLASVPQPVPDLQSRKMLSAKELQDSTRNCFKSVSQLKETWLQSIMMSLI